MSTPVLVLGESGGGKSTSLENFDPAKTLLIQAIAKPLPFQATGWAPRTEENKSGNIFVTDKADEIQAIMKGTKRKVIVVDDFQYVMANEFMRRSDERGYDKFTEIGRNAWDIIRTAAQLPDDVRVYILGHTDTNDQGKIKIKTIGKMLDDKITVEGMFSIVLRCITRDEEYFFSTKTNGYDTVKTPKGMFDKSLIPNDLSAVDARICEYWNIPRN